MRNLVALRVKANARYICQECGSTEFIQAHHQIPGEDDSLVVLCAECHSKKHPDVPKNLFFNKNCQPYWCNKSASTLARQLAVHPRTIIRTAKKLGILKGTLTVDDETLIKSTIPKLNKKLPVLKEKVAKRPKPEPIKLTKITIETNDLTTMAESETLLHLDTGTINDWIETNKIISLRLGGDTFIPTIEIERIKQEGVSVR